MKQRRHTLDDLELKDRNGQMANFAHLVTA